MSWSDEFQRMGPGQLYVLEFSDGIVKIGGTHSWELRQLWYTWFCAENGVTIVRQFISEPVAYWRKREARLIKRMPRIGRQDREWHSLADFDETVAKVEAVCRMTYRELFRPADSFWDREDVGWDLRDSAGWYVFPVDYSKVPD